MGLKTQCPQKCKSALKFWFHKRVKKQEEQMWMMIQCVWTLQEEEGFETAVVLAHIKGSY